MHFARSIVLGYHSIPKINWGSFRGRREEKWGSFRGQFGDHFGGCTEREQRIPPATQSSSGISLATQQSRRSFIRNCTSEIACFLTLLVVTIHSPPLKANLIKNDRIRLGKH